MSNETFMQNYTNEYKEQIAKGAEDRENVERLLAERMPLDFLSDVIYLRFYDGVVQRTNQHETRLIVVNAQSDISGIEEAINRGTSNIVRKFPLIEQQGEHPANLSWMYAFVDEDLDRLVDAFKERDGITYQITIEKGKQFQISTEEMAKAFF